MSDDQQGDFRFFHDYYVNHSGLKRLWYNCFYSFMDTEGTLTRVHSQSTIYLFNWSPVSLWCGEQNVLFINQGHWSDLLCFKKYNKLLKFCSSDKYEYVSPSGVYLIFRIKLSHFDFFCHWCLDFTINIGVQPTCAHVAHNISPVPVLNCELLNGPEPYREGVLSFHGVKVFTGKWEKSLKLVSKAAENSPNICGVSWGESNFVARRDDFLKAGLRFLMITLAAGLENPGKWNITLVSLRLRTSLQRQNSSLCGFGESEVMIKHLMPVERRSAALFMLLGFRCYKKNWQELLYFLYKCDKNYDRKQ